MGTIIAIASIVVPSVIGLNNDLNPDEFLHLTPAETSWFGNQIRTLQIHNSIHCNKKCNFLFKL